MITLDLPSQTEQLITTKAQSKGLTAESYLTHRINEWTHERTLGGGEHLLVAITDNFDEPLDDFEDY